MNSASSYREMVGDRVQCRSHGELTGPRIPRVGEQPEEHSTDCFAGGRVGAPDSTKAMCATYMVGPGQRLEESPQSLTPPHAACRVLLVALSLAECACIPIFAARLSELNRRDEQFPGFCPSLTEEG
jgi:hypothetical protein